MSAPKFLYLTYGTWEEGFDPEAYWSKEEDDDVTYVRGDLYDKLRESLATKERECERLLEYIAQFVVMDDVGDETFVLGPIVRDEELADSLFRHIAPPVRNEETYNPYHDNEPKQVIRRAALSEGSERERLPQEAVKCVPVGVGNKYPVCSLCYAEIAVDQGYLKPNYCPYCGARIASVTAATMG